MTQSNTLLRYSVGTTVPSLRVSTFDHIKVPMYSKELQMKYASTFDSLEKLLNQIKEKTNILRSLKQFLLQVLFLWCTNLLIIKIGFCQKFIMGGFSYAKKDKFT